MTNGKFNKIIGAGITGAAALSAYLLVLRPWHLRWGLSDEEVSRCLQGMGWCPTPSKKPLGR